MKIDAKNEVKNDLNPDLGALPVEKKRRRRNEHNASAYDADVFELLQAIDAWRRKSHRSFPAWSEVLQILKGLGWRKSAEAAAQPITPAQLEPVDPMEPVAPKPEE